MDFNCFRFCLLCSKLESVGHCLWGKQHHDAIHTLQKCCTVAIQLGNFNTKVSKYLGINLKTDSYSYWWKPNAQSTSWCLIWSPAIVILYHHSSEVILWPHNQRRGLYEVPAGGDAALDREVGRWKTLHLVTGLCAMPHKQENPVLAARKFWLYHPKHLSA